DRLRRRGVEVVRATVESIDPKERTARAGGQTLTADAVVVALGADLAPEMVPGLEAAGHNLYTVEGASAIRDALATFDGGRIVLLTATPLYRCPAAPYEAAMLIEAALRRRGVRDRTQIDIYSAEPGPMLVTGPAVSGAVRQVVESKAIRYHPEHQITRADAAQGRVEFANGTTAAFDLLVYVPPHRAPGVVRNAGLTNESGWIPVDRHSFETAFPGVFAIGDVTTVPLVMGKPLPKAGVFAHEQAEVVAANIVHAWTGRGARKEFDGHGQCFLEIGDGRAGIGAGDFYAEPTPQVVLRAPGRRWHWAKVLFEKRWFWDWF
ncbi:MAG: NAD(P)/FAD-dependent oxidoreductase, partial [Gemmatimonadaceae bacterium]